MEENIKWLDKWTAIINGGGPYEFTGIIRGSGTPVIRYFAPSFREVVKGLILKDWIFIIKKDGEIIINSNNYRKKIRDVIMLSR